MSDAPLDLTWPALLAKWTEFAQASAAFPRTGQGERWRASVPSAIGLQAVTYALGELSTLPEEERAVGLARAGAVIQKHAGQLRALWGDELSGEMASLISDAEAALRARRPRPQG